MPDTHAFDRSFPTSRRIFATDADLAAHYGIRQLLPKPPPNTPTVSQPVDPTASFQLLFAQKPDNNIPPKGASPAVLSSPHTTLRDFDEFLTSAFLVPPSTPTQARHYITPSMTSRKELPAAFARKRMHNQEFGDQEDELAGDAPGPDATEREQIEWKRRQNTLAARKSRKRKLEHQAFLEKRVDELRAEVEMWKARVQTIGDELSADQSTHSQDGDPRASPTSGPFQTQTPTEHAQDHDDNYYTSTSEPLRTPTNKNNMKNADNSHGDNASDHFGKTPSTNADNISTPKQRGIFTQNSITGSAFSFVGGNQQQIENNNNQRITDSYNQYNRYDHHNNNWAMLVAGGIGGIGMGTAGTSLYFNKYWEPRTPAPNNTAECPTVASLAMLLAIFPKTKFRLMVDICHNEGG
ncbi:hypothetical protein VKT23_011587 [Stygiomarasmius scandens]